MSMKARQKTEGPTGQRGAVEAVRPVVRSEQRCNSAGARHGTQPMDSRKAVALAERRAERMSAPLVTRTAARIAALRRIALVARGNSAETQHRRLLRAFRGGPLTSIDGREHLDVLAFPARVSELEQAGHRFVRCWVLQVTSMGRTHRVVQITLVSKEDDTD